LSQVSCHLSWQHYGTLAAGSAEAALAVRPCHDEPAEFPASVAPELVHALEETVMNPIAIRRHPRASGRLAGAALLALVFGAALGAQAPGGTVPAGEYRGLVFEIGVPFELNHQDPTLVPAPLKFTALTWPWSVGYKFTTIDFDTKPAGARTMVPIPNSTESISASGFSVHLGSTDCVSSGFRVPPRAPCANPNRPTFRFESFDVEKQVVVMDLGALLAGTDVTRNTPDTASGCMSFANDDDCLDIMGRFGLPFRGKAPAGRQFIQVAPR